MIERWLVQRGLSPVDAEDVRQEVMAVVVRELPNFQHNGRTGAFRNWLRTVAINRMREFRRAGRKHRAVALGSQIASLADQLDDPVSPLSRRWNADHDRYMLESLLRAVESRFAPKSIAAFRSIVFEDRSASEVADELGMTLNAVRIAQSRILSALRSEGQGLIDMD